jgi:hypothetical protein
VSSPPTCTACIGQSEGHANIVRVSPQPTQTLRFRIWIKPPGTRRRSFECLTTTSNGCQLRP